MMPFRRVAHKSKWTKYEREKKKLRGLPPKEYERELKKLAERLKV